jgi:hypothetical protein
MFEGVTSLEGLFEFLNFCLEGESHGEEIFIILFGNSSPAFQAILLLL